MDKKPGLSRSITSLEPSTHKRPRAPEEPTERKRFRGLVKAPVVRSNTVPISPLSKEKPKKEAPSLSRSGTVPITNFFQAQAPKSRTQDRSSSKIIHKYTTPTGQEIQIRHGDITEEDTTCIVNAANSFLAHGGGVAGAIRVAAGKVLQQESNDWIKRYGEVETGEVAWTTGGNMKCPFVVHAVGPVYSNGRCNEAKLLRDATLNSLLLANEKKWFSIAIPAISSGIFGFPKAECASILIDTVVKFCKDFPDSDLKQIRLTNFDQPTVKVFSFAFEKFLAAVATKEEEESMEASDEAEREDGSLDDTEVDDDPKEETSSDSEDIEIPDSLELKQTKDQDELTSEEEAVGPTQDEEEIAITIPKEEDEEIPDSEELKNLNSDKEIVGQNQDYTKQ